jgi:hypothetical protein
VRSLAAFSFLKAQRMLAAFLERMPLDAGIRLEVREHREMEGAPMTTTEYLRQSAVRARAVAKSASAKASHLYLEVLATRFEEQALESERRTAGNKPTIRSA